MLMMNNLIGFGVRRASGGGGGGSAWLPVAISGLDTDDVGWNGYTLRQVINSAVMANTGLSKVRVSFNAASGGMVIGNAYIGMAAGSGDAYDFAGTPSELLFSGGSGVTVPSNGTSVSDELTFTILPGGNLVISLQFTGGADTKRKDPLTGWQSYYKSGADAATVNASGYTTWKSALCISLVEAAA
ncbi:MAG: hypothetical protein EOS75_03850 [Mesorhizobium sp.]|nr:MAG: hypothetical protein EOS74_08295 [Mesorhizobium sp.]RWD58853.1 MAG: hypothetical protein EOS75_03850 [Mesorhizobium sp.]